MALASWKAGAGHLSLRDCQLGRGSRARAPYLRAADRMSTAALLNTPSRVSVWSVAPKRLARSPSLSAWQQRPIRHEKERRALRAFRTRSRSDENANRKNNNNKKKITPTRTFGGKSRGMAIARVERSSWRTRGAREIEPDRTRSATATAAMAVDIFKTDSKRAKTSTVMSDIEVDEMAKRSFGGRNRVGLARRDRASATRRRSASPRHPVA